MSGLSRRSLLVGGMVVGGALATPGWAQALPAKAVNGWVTSTMSRMTVEEKIGQLFFQVVYGASADADDARNTPLYGVSRPADVVAKYHLGGVIYFAWADNVANPTQIAGLSNGLQQAALGVSSKVKVPLFIATDQEMGVVTRIGLPATQFPGSMALGASRSTAYARTAAKITGQELRAMGVNTDFAPDADVNVNALNPVIGVRSFSSDPALVSQMVAAQVKGYQNDAGISASAKHFPGHGDTATDSHTGLPTITHSRAEWERVDAPPFRAAIEAGVDMIMSAHLMVPALDPSGDPATLSKPILTGILRGELGYTGVISTDSLAMQGVREKYGDAEVAIRALEAGADILLMPPDMPAAWSAVMGALESGRLTMADIDAKVRRLLTLKYRRGLVDDALVDVASVGSVVGTAEHRAIADDLTDHTVTLIKNADGTLPLAVKGRTVLVTGYGVTTTQLVADELTKRGAIVSVQQTGTSPTAAQVSSVAAAAASSDLVIVLTMNVNAAQASLVSALQKTGTKLVVAAVRNPYDINRFPSVPTYLCTYSYSPVMPGALVRVLCGEVAPVGKLPVDIPTADNAGVLYPYGFGLSY